MSGYTILLWMAGIHLFGFLAVGLLMMPMLRDEDAPGEEDHGSSDDGWGNLPGSGPDPRGLPGGGLPLPDAIPSRIRLREPGRIADLRPGRERRPVRDPARQPARPQPVTHD